MKAGISNRSAKLAQCSLAISEVKTDPLACLRHQPSERIWRVHDISVGQQHVGWRRRLPERQREALLLCPGLAHPSCRGSLSVHDRQPVGSAAHFRSTQRDSRRTIAALVIDQNDRERAGVVLIEQGADTFRNAVGLIAGGNERSDRRPQGSQQWGSQQVTAVVTH